jgi:predicted transcriptional regulator YdeE
MQNKYRMELQIYNLANDIEVFCIKAKSFPDGILAAHQTLHALVPFSEQRKYFGISRPENGGGIVYKAAAEELKKGELSSHGLEQFTIRKGEYIYIDIPDFMNKIEEIGKTFQQILKDPRIDPQGACIEWYVTKNDCKCMVRILN